MITPRWPLHPRPGPGEALSSWLGRIADLYGMSLDVLVRHNLGPDYFDLRFDRDSLDLDPPGGVLAALHDRTGIPLAQLRRMTIAGWVPWLLDELSADQPEAFDTYVRQDCVLFGPGEAPQRELAQWRPWLPVHASPRIRRACPVCTASPGRDLMLMAQLPVMLSCPEHGCGLVPAGMLIPFINRDGEGVAVSSPVAVMDERTHEGVTTGTVTLPRRPVHVGVWFRLLRTLLDEVNTPPSQLRRQVAKQAVGQIWRATGRPTRAGQIRWIPYEALDWPRQQAMLEAAAVAMHMVESGALAGRGTLGSLLYDDPYRPVRSDPAPADAWQRAMNEFSAAVEAASNDREAARRLLHTFTAFCRTPASFERTRQDLINCGLPEQFLPHWPGMNVMVLQT